MTTTELQKLDAWIAEYVFDQKPFKVAMAFTADESGVALVEGEIIGRHDVEKFCQDYPQYHCKIVDEYPRYTTDPAAAMEVWKKCVEKNAQLTTYFEAGEYAISQPQTDSCWHPTLELAIAKFSRRLFDKS